jgi:hypothetical protein
MKRNHWLGWISLFTVGVYHFTVNRHFGNVLFPSCPDEVIADGICVVGLILSLTFFRTRD